ncbi:DUF6767 domain-containing protein [Intrasporangium flavum]|uniref:DUF6767 domain-containing protein n=1 Tax=Intrasporangium flavum TaxID=1428657 RepID=UPI0009F9DA9D|nr:DUF6767 domain-containing protein [Intrasporangium flavum]
MSRAPVPQCPIRVGEPCTLCVPGATGPQDCGLVWLVQDDPELRAELARRRSAFAEDRRRERADGLS